MGNYIQLLSQPVKKYSDKLWNLSTKPPLHEGGWITPRLGDSVAMLNYILKYSEKNNTTERIYVDKNLKAPAKYCEILDELDHCGKIEFIRTHDPSYEFQEGWEHGHWKIRFTSDYCPTKNPWMPNENKIISYQLDGGNGGGICKKCNDGEIETFVEYFSEKGYEVCLLDKSKTLKECVDILSRSEFYVGVDTGITHLALCVGTPIHMIRNCRSIVNIIMSYRHKAEDMNLHKNIRNFLRVYNNESIKDGSRGCEQLSLRQRDRDENGNKWYKLVGDRYGDEHLKREMSWMLEDKKLM